MIAALRSVVKNASKSAIAVVTVRAKSQMGLWRSTRGEKPQLPRGADTAITRYQRLTLPSANYESPVAAGSTGLPGSVVASSILRYPSERSTSSTSLQVGNGRRLERLYISIAFMKTISSSE